MSRSQFRSVNLDYLLQWPRPRTIIIERVETTMLVVSGLVAMHLRPAWYDRLEYLNTKSIFHFKCQRVLKRFQLLQCAAMTASHDNIIHILLMALTRQHPAFHLLHFHRFPFPNRHTRYIWYVTVCQGSNGSVSPRVKRC